MNKLVEECKTCGKVNDRRVPSKLARLAPAFGIGMIVLNISSYIVNPVGWTNALTLASGWFSLLTFLGFGAMIGFGLIVWEVVGTAGKW